MTSLRFTTFTALLVVCMCTGLDSKPCGHDSPTIKAIVCTGYGYIILVGVLVLFLVVWVCAHQACRKPGLVIQKTVNTLKSFYAHSLKNKRLGSSLDNCFSVEEKQTSGDRVADENDTTEDIHLLNKRDSCPEINLSSPGNVFSSSRCLSHESIVSDIQPLTSTNLGIKLASSGTLDQHSFIETESLPCIVSIENISSHRSTNSDTDQATDFSGSDASLASSASSHSNVAREKTLPIQLLSSSVYREQLRKSNSIGQENVTSTYFSSALTQTDGGGSDLDKFRPKPILSASWQAMKGFQSAGGSLTMADSDVRLEVPANAVPPAMYVDVVVATFTDLPQVRDVLGLGQDEYIMSPAVEFHASGSSHFDKPVHIFLPHGLPLSFPEEHVKIYHFHSGDDGNLQRRPIPSKNVFDQMFKRNDVQISSESATLRDEETGMEFGPGYFQLLPCGELIVTTTRFCGYVCTACREYVDQVPQIYLMATSSLVQLVQHQWQVELTYLLRPLAPRGA